MPKTSLGSNVATEVSISLVNPMKPAKTSCQNGQWGLGALLVSICFIFNLAMDTSLPSENFPLTLGSNMVPKAHVGLIKLL